MPDFATFTAPGGGDPVAHVRQMVEAAHTTTGDMLLCGMITHDRLVKRTGEGVDLNGAPFAPYSTKGPYYFYAAPGVKGLSRTERIATIAGRFGKIKGFNKRTGKGGGGRRTTLGIRYDGGYAEAKAAMGRGVVDLYGLVQHTHMLMGIDVHAGGSVLDSSSLGLMGIGASSELEPWSQNQPCNEVRVGLYDEDLAARARGNDEGTDHLPQRKFLGANPQDLDVCRVAVTERMVARMKGHK